MPEEKMRIEHDSMGEIAVPADKYWGAQTERSRRNFPAGAGHETMPEEILRAFAILKKAAAEANRALMPQRMTEEKCAAISRACDEILAGQLDGNFPLVVFQTGSGTQTNMNVNEGRSEPRQRHHREKLLHPNDDVNMSQSSAAPPSAPASTRRRASIQTVAAEIAKLTGKDQSATGSDGREKFHALTSKDELVFAHGAVKALAADMMKIANDVRWLASGPRDGLGEIFIPENEPGSSIITAVGLAASQGNFELNVFLPVCIYNFLQSARLLAASIASFDERCVSGIRANREKMAENMERSLMLVTALTPHIGYERAAEVAKLAHREDLTLRESCLRLGYMTAEAFDAAYRPEKMV